MFTCTIRRHSSVSAPSTGPSSITPALFTSPCRPPSSECARSTNARAWSSSPTSASIATARPPSPSIRSARASIRSARRAPSATAAPAPASASAVASPMPEEAPVMATTRPSSGCGTRRSYSAAAGR